MNLASQRGFMISGDGYGCLAKNKYGPGTLLFRLKELLLDTTILGGCHARF